jgi:hypothetical protein
MLEAWFGLRGPDEAANQWIRKTGAEHYGEHLTRLRDWVDELIDLRTRPGRMSGKARPAICHRGRAQTMSEDRA